jgi:hypothetical protein
VLTESEQKIADDVVARLSAVLTNDRGSCEIMHRGLVDEFKLAVATERAEFMEIIEKDRTSFRQSLADTRDSVFEKATGKKWEDREQVRDGIGFAISARLLTKKALFVAVGVVTVAVLAWMGLR